MALDTISWLKAQVGFSAEDIFFNAIAEERGVVDYSTPHTELSAKTKDLMLADIVYKVVLFFPLSTSSKKISHSGFSQEIGSQAFNYSKDRISWALSIYQRYDDDKYNDLLGVRPVKAIKITDKL